MARYLFALEPNLCQLHRELNEGGLPERHREAVPELFPGSTRERHFSIVNPTRVRTEGASFPWALPGVADAESFSSFLGATFVDA